jgi:hypothetical protein
VKLSSSHSGEKSSAADAASAAHAAAGTLKPKQMSIMRLD